MGYEWAVGTRTRSARTGAELFPSQGGPPRARAQLLSVHHATIGPFQMQTASHLRTCSAALHLATPQAGNSTQIHVQRASS
eukprot:scaffold544_cov117-Isochrysis_galbana.AAC.2